MWDSWARQLTDAPPPRMIGCVTNWAIVDAYRMCAFGSIYTLDFLKHS
jgi:hypothetical protein